MKIEVSSWQWFSKTYISRIKIFAVERTRDGDGNKSLVLLETTCLRTTLSRFRMHLHFCEGNHEKSQIFHWKRCEKKESEERTRSGTIITKVRIMIYAKTWRKTRVRFKWEKCHVKKKKWTNYNSEKWHEKQGTKGKQKGGVGKKRRNAKWNGYRGSWGYDVGAKARGKGTRNGVKHGRSLMGEKDTEQRKITW